MTKEALDARDGQGLYSEDDFREMVEYAQHNPGQWLHESPSGAAQASADPTDATVPDMADYMDGATAKRFEEMNDEWQEMARSGWVDITTKFAPDAPKDWPDALQSMISQMYPQAKIQGGIRGVPVAGVQDLVDSSKGASPDGTTPFVLSILSPGYTEAYELIPEGSLMREYLDIRLGSFSERGWESIKAQPDEPYPVQAPKLDARDEFELRRMLTNAGDAEWLVKRLRSLDADAAREYEATNDSTERLAILRRLVEVDGKGAGGRGDTSGVRHAVARLGRGEDRRLPRTHPYLGGGERGAQPHDAETGLHQPRGVDAVRRSDESRRRAGRKGGEFQSWAVRHCQGDRADEGGAGGGEDSQHRSRTSRGGGVRAADTTEVRVRKQGVGETPTPVRQGRVKQTTETKGKDVTATK